MKLFKGTRQIVIYEDVEVFAETYYKAIELFENDANEVKITNIRESDYEVNGRLIEEKEND